MSNRRAKPITACLMPILAAGAVLIALGGFFLRQDTVSGTSLAGLLRPVEVYEDKHGIPHIIAQSVEDAYVSLGFLHARDRLWQMEVNRRAGSGRLAEIFGIDALEQDRFFRTLGLESAAQANLQHLDKASLRNLDAYARGVNAYLAHTTFLPTEFQLLRAPKPEPWRPLDSLTWLKTVAWRLSGNWWEELLNLRLRNRLPPPQYADLFPPYPGDASRVLPDVTDLYAELEPLAGKLPTQHHEEVRKSIGSNNWVVDGRRTLSGKPLLANDPHLPLSAPSLWYFAHLHAPGLNVIGATLPGVPGVLLGRNDRVAWAFTNTGPDTQDIFLERLIPGQASRYETPDGPGDFEQLRETIKVKDAADEFLTVRISRHGPVISDVGADAKRVAADGMVLALSWVGLQPDDATIRFMLNAGSAHTGTELKEMARDFHTPQQNIVYADADGHIGFIAAGRVPIRSKENRLKGLLPAPGWLASSDWQGFIPFEQLPQQSGSDTGRIVTANQKITPPDYPYWITSNWALPYRAERIASLLAERDKHDVASFAAIQNDVGNPVAAQLLPMLLRIKPDDDETTRILESLHRWDRRMAEESPQPLIFAEWIRQLTVVLYGEKLADLAEMIGDYNPQFLVNVLRNEQGSAERWCEPPKFGAVLCDAEIMHALHAALDNLKRHHGAAPTNWRWGHAHITRFKHIPFGEMPLLGNIYSVEAESAGGMDTINVSGYRYDEDDGRYVGEAGAAFRAIYDLAEPDNSVFILGPGQSGSPFTSHYRDMAPAWVQGGYVPMLTDRERIVREAEKHITLSPP